MAESSRYGPLRIGMLILCATVAWFYNQYQKDHPQANRPGSVTLSPAGPEPSTDPSRRRENSEKKGKYEVYRNCRLAVEKHNDGDSFEVRLPDGHSEVFRLYYVDCPESDFKTYGGGENNHQRISEQAEMFGVTDEQAVEVGKEAKHYSLDLLSAKPFTLYTEWDSPYHDDRFHAFVEVEVNGKPRWLHELLVEKGFCRIHTKGAELPDGTSFSAHRDFLRAKEREAKAHHMGGWGLR